MFFTFEMLSCYDVKGLRRVKRSGARFIGV